jgi:hypothetical protein
MNNEKPEFVIPNNLKERMLSHNQTIEYISDSLRSDSPFMVSRFGSIEGEVIFRTLFKGPLDIDQPLRSKARNNAGIAKPNNQTLKRFSLEYVASIAKADMLAIWNFPEQIKLAQITTNDNLCQLNHIDPVFNFRNEGTTWTRALQNKNILIIHPFENSIRHQYINKSSINTISQILPDFNLSTLIPPLTVDRHNDVPYSWDEELEIFKNKVLNYDFDVAIIGAGGYGAPIASFIKQLGKKSIHLGGATQLLFGIIGKRWENRSYMQDVIGDGWIRPSSDEKHKNANKIEDGCYW